MTNIFSLENYREIIKQLLQDRKATNKVTLAKLADVCRVQRPYVSQVLGGKADFSSDQLFAVSRFFQLTEEETDYLLLVLEFERSSLTKRKVWLRKKIRQQREKHISTKRVVPKDRMEGYKEIAETSAYYLDPILQRIHILISIPSYSSNIGAIANKVGASRSRVTDAISKLVSLGLLSETKNGFTLTKNHIHLNSDSPLCVPHQILLRVQSLAQMQSLTGKDSFRYSLTFSGTSELELRIREFFLNLITEIQPEIEKAPSEKLFQLNFDLFPWD